MSDFYRVAKGIHRLDINGGDPHSPLALLEVHPGNALEELEEGRLPFSLESIVVEHTQVRTNIIIPLGPEEKLYGAGLQFKCTEERGRTKYLRVNSDPKHDTGETHAPVPFYVSSTGYGILIDTARIVTIHFGSTVRADSSNPPQPRSSSDDPFWRATMLSDSVEAEFIGDKASVYVIKGNSMMEVVRKFNLLTGPGVIPPLYALGFWYRVPSKADQDWIVAKMEECRAKGFPVDVCGLEPGWHSTNYPDSYLFHPVRFPDPNGLSAALRNMGIHLNVWEHPWVSPEAPFYEEIKERSGTNTVWGGLAPDLADESVQEAFIAQHERDHLSAGIEGYKLDECDGSELTDCSWMFPATARFPSGLDGEEMRQVYGLLYQNMIKRMFEKHGKRTFGLVRAGGTGSSGMPFVLYSDLYDHKDYITALYNSGFSGLLWTPEVRRAVNSEDWVRRFQSNVFSPLNLLNAWGDATEPWSYSDVAGIIRKLIGLRMSLLPYIYNAYAEYAFKGIPVIRPMELEFGNLTTRMAQEGHKEFDTTDAPYGRTRTFSFSDQYMFGPSMLVAPMVAPDKERKVFLPEGIWHDAFTGEVLNGGDFITVHKDLSEMPVYIKDGALIPYTKELMHAPDEPVPVYVRGYGNIEGSTLVLYDDDGVTLDWKKGLCSHTLISIEDGRMQVRRNGGLYHWDVQDILSEENIFRQDFS